MHDPNHSPLKDLERAALLDPPDTLWPRLRAGQRKAVARRRMLVGASTAALVVALAAILPWTSLSPVEPPAQAAAEDVLEQIVTLDRALQAAYENDANDHEIAPMWAARAQLMHDLSSARPN